MALANSMFDFDSNFSHHSDKKVVNQAMPLNIRVASSPALSRGKEYYREQVLLLPALYILDCDASFRNVSFSKEPSKNCHPENDDHLRKCNMEISGEGTAYDSHKALWRTNNYIWFLAISLKIQM